MNTDPRNLLLKLMHVAIDAADPVKCLPPFLPEPPPGRTLVVGAGKAAAKMAHVVEEKWQGPLDGLVVTRYGHKVECDQIDIVLFTV